MTNYYPSKKEFLKLSKRGNLVPVYKRVLADLETPVSAFIKMSGGSYSYLLESAEGQEKIGRFSFIGSSPSLVFKSKGSLIEIIRKGKKKERFRTQRDPLDELKGLMASFKFVNIEGLPRFCGGLVGYLGYDMVRFFEELPDKNPDKPAFPDSIFMLTDNLLVFDHLNHEMKIVSLAHIKGNPLRAYEEAIARIEKICSRLKRPLPAKMNRLKASRTKGIRVRSNFTKREFKRSVSHIKRYIKKGDIVQAVLSQRLEVKLRPRSFDIYRALRFINPSPYMYYLRFNDFDIVGSSPEILVRCEDSVVQTRPIAGTRPRGKSSKEDEALIEDLLNDPKERAEHIMLVDLGRNDIGRVCEYGSIAVPEFMVIEKYSHVMHIVSDCIGRLAKGKDMFDLVRATFPAGTVTGAPKIRAMEIIDELENLRRGPYAGCVGYFSFSGNLDMCITIRTIIVKNKRAYIQAGAGVVADSRPEKEYQETLNKTRGMIKAIKLAGGGLDLR